VGGAKDTHHPRVKVVIIPNKHDANKWRRASAKEVHDLAITKASTEKCELNLCIIHFLKVKINLPNLLHLSHHKIEHKLTRANG
jgi:hypothetical protein